MGREVSANYEGKEARRGVTLLCLLFVPLCFAPAQTLHLPPRPADALSGSAFVRSISTLSLAEREAQIETEILRGNVPEFLRHLKPVEVQAVIDGATNTATLFATPDYLAVGSAEDYFLTPMTPQVAQRIADATGCVLPTRRMVDAIFSAAGAKLAPAPIRPSATMTGISVLAQHNEMVRMQRRAELAAHPLGSLVAGHKKDVVLSNRLTNALGKVAIYGWHHPDGKPIQPLYVGHSDSWVDYSHGVRLVHETLKLNGKDRRVSEVLRDANLATLLSHEGPMWGARYPTNPATTTNRFEAARSPSIPRVLTWRTNSAFDERSTTFQLLPDVRVQHNESLPSTSAPDGSPTMLVLYALPNGNTIEQTVGRKLKPGDDWHFDVQHVAAQMRFIRAADTNRNWVVAYLETEQKSWPAWRKEHSSEPALIPGIVDALVRARTNQLVRVGLSGHSGGGSFIFGYLNAVDGIPDHVERIAFLDANYAYDPALDHAEKLARWLKTSERHHLNVLAYNDGVALLDGKPFVSATGGTWYRSHLMKTNLSSHFDFASRTVGGIELVAALSNRVQFLLKDNPERKILHTVQVDRNGFIQAMFSGTPREGRGYEYLGSRAYEKWIDPESFP